MKLLVSILSIKLAPIPKASLILAPPKAAALRAVSPAPVYASTCEVTGFHSNIAITYS